MEVLNTFSHATKYNNSEFDAIAKALGKFQFTCPAIAKKKNGYGYKYAELSDIVDNVSQHMKDAGLSYAQLTSTSDDGDTINVTTVLFHESGQNISSTLSASISKNVTLGKTGKPSMTNIQQMGALITYLRRYGFSSMLGIVTEEDTDGLTTSVSSRDNRQTNNNPTYKSQAHNDVKTSFKAQEKKLIDPQRIADAIAKLQESVSLDELKDNYSSFDRDIALSNQVKEMKDDMKNKLLGVL